MFVILAVKYGKFVCYIHEIVMIKHAEPNQACYFVRYNRVFVITMIVITEFDCTMKSLSLRIYNYPATVITLNDALQAHWT